MRGCGETSNETKRRASFDACRLQREAEPQAKAAHKEIDRDFNDPTFSVEEIEVCLDLAVVDSDEIAGLPEAE